VQRLSLTGWLIVRFECLMMLAGLGQEANITSAEMLMFEVIELNRVKVNTPIREI
jgi:hypothetical protein